MKLPWLIITALLGMSWLPSSANSIKRIDNADGSIEFSNVGAASQQKQTLIYKSREGDSVLFSDKKPTYGQFEVLKYSCFACNPTSTINWHTIRLNTTAFAEPVNRFAKHYAVEPALVRAVMHAESAFNPDALSNKGAQGLMQLMPATAKSLAVTDAFNTEQNIEGGIKYLASLLTQFNGDIQLATAAYNAGPGAVSRFNGVPPYAETKVYVERVGILYQRYQQAS